GTAQDPPPACPTACRPPCRCAARRRAARAAARATRHTGRADRPTGVALPARPAMATAAHRVGTANRDWTTRRRRFGYHSTRRPEPHLGRCPSVRRCPVVLFH